MPEELQPQPVVAEPQPPVTPPVEAPPSNPRQEVYAKYEKLYGGSVEQAPPAPPVEVPPAPEPTPIREAVALQETIRSLQAEVQALKSHLTPPPVPPPVAPPAASFVDKLREGDFEGAEKLLVEKATQASTDQITQKAVSEAVEAIRVQNEIESYVARLRAENPEVVPFERYLNAPVQARIEAAKAAGKIQSPADFVREYKVAVDAEVAEIRKISQQYRAAGKSEAMVTKREVLSATTLQPQLVSPERTGQPEQPEGDTTESYLAERMARLNRMRGLAS